MFRKLLNLLGNSLVWLFYLFTVTAFGTFAYQMYLYIKAGVWQENSVINVLNYFGLAWAESPEIFIGLHELLSEVPLWTVLLISAFIVMFIDFAIESRSAD